MVKYYLTAMALKGFSLSPSTRRIYRRLGNNLGAKKRTTAPMPAYYIERINRMLRIARDYGIPKNGSRLIELGTGWCHWEAIMTRLFFNVRSTLYDVWDNRQLSALKNYLDQLDSSLDKLEIDPAQHASAHRTIGAIKEVANYDELYSLLDFEYVLDPDGRLERLEKGSFDLVVSAGVLEHINADDASRIVDGIGTLLKPGGFSIHSINIRDHLYLYDRTVSPKQYLQYSDRIWSLCFQNGVQYINRIQRSQWLELFSHAGLELVEEQVEQEDLSNLKISTSYHRYNNDDLSCGGLQLIHRMPL